MTEASEPLASAPPSPKAGTRKSCLVMLAVGLALLGGGGLLVWTLQSRAERSALKVQEQAAQEAFDPVLEKMGEAADQATSYDLDKTIRVIDETDKMLEDTRNLPEYLAWAARQDYTGVAPEVLQARKDVLSVVMRLYASQVAQEDQEELTRFSAETILQMASLVGVEGKAGVGITGSFSLDREQAEKLVAQAREERIERKGLRKAVRQSENDLLTALVNYSGVYARYLEEWDRLCLSRDQAYLAVTTEDWAVVAAAAERAIRLAPNEREAHLLLALALVEGGPQVLPEVDVKALLYAYIEAHPDATAPALVLLGMEEEREGNFTEAELSLMQAAAYYPRESQSLSDLFNPYEARSYLRATREGRYVLQQYQSTMMGAGRFSPDLQLARLAFRTGKPELGRKKLMEHFYRRRAQKEWAFVLDDIRYAMAEFGDAFRAIFPPESYLDLVMKPSLMGLSGNLSLSVRNRSDIVLHNATLLLCVHYTDMYPDDYEVIVGGDTKPALNAHEETSFGEVSVDAEVLGKKRARDDVVRIRAILVADEAVTWVDTEEYRVAEAKEFRDKPPTPLNDTPARAMPGVMEALGRESSLSIEKSRFGKDGVVIRLPRDLVLLSPIFDLKVGDKTLSPDLNRLEIDDGRIRLQFENAIDTSDESRLPTLTLVTRTPWGREIRLAWEPTGPGGTYGKPKLAVDMAEQGETEGERSAGP
jgi:hypothetical protein